MNHPPVHPAIPEFPESLLPVKGRGAALDPPNRFERRYSLPDWADFEHDPEFMAEQQRRPTQYFPDRSQTIVSENDSPDIPFRYSINPYRGCEHGCAYCYARPTHEYLGWNGGLDFETRILVKLRAAELFREWLARETWEGEPVTFSGVTDCYQPAEKRFELTRQCLEVAEEYGQPVSIITKNALILRDVELLVAMARRELVYVFISLTTLDAGLARSLEPRASTPEARLRTIRELTAQGVPVGVMTAPIIPGLNDHEIPRLLESAREAGARRAGYVLLRLPGVVRGVFFEWLQRALPEQRERVLARLRAVRGGAWSSARFGERLRGTGPHACNIAHTFDVFCKKLGLDRPAAPLSMRHFRRPLPTRGQLRLFE